LRDTSHPDAVWSKLIDGAATSQYRSSKALGITVPATMLGRADEVIK
jgi:hypothetical protein